MTRRQTVNFVIIFAIFAAFAAAILDPLTFLRRAEYRGEVKVLFESLQLDMTKDQVQRLMDIRKYPHLEFRQVKDEMWFASAPYEFGAQSWVLVIEFQRQRVSALRVRTDDGFKEFQRPADAPADRVSPSVGR